MTARRAAGLGGGLRGGLSEGLSGGRVLVSSGNRAPMPATPRGVRCGSTGHPRGCCPEVRLHAHSTCAYGCGSKRHPPEVLSRSTPARTFHMCLWVWKQASPPEVLPRSTPAGTFNMCFPAQPFHMYFPGRAIPHVLPMHTRTSSSSTSIRVWKQASLPEVLLRGMPACTFHMCFPAMVVRYCRL